MTATDPQALADRLGFMPTPAELDYLASATDAQLSMLLMQTAPQVDAAPQGAVQYLTDAQVADILADADRVLERMQAIMALADDLALGMAQKIQQATPDAAQGSTQA